MKIFYTSDLHFCHSNILSFDKRPFQNTEEMEKELIKRWNSVVSKQDMVYILGDFCWSLDEKEWTRICRKLNGNKVLILGNHDLKRMNSNIKKLFGDIKDYKEIKDNGRRVILSHYPIPFYKSDYDPNMYMLYGHVHDTWENDLMEKVKALIKTEQKTRDERISNKCNLYNCWCGFYNYTPVTLDEIIAYWEEQSCKE